MDAKHTSGPWRLDATNDRLAHRADLIAPDYHFIDAGDGCFVDKPDGPRGFGLSGILSTADARLIAAAPDLLEAARKALNYITNTEGEFGITLESGDMLRAAIKSAQGGE